jgi:hypothetical protein
LSSLGALLRKVKERRWMAGMIRALFIATALGLTACAASTPTEAPSEPDFALAADMSCNADHARVCHVDGCAPGQAGEEWQAPISLHVPRNGGAGRFCLATGCEDAQIEPTLTRALGWTAIVRTHDRTNKNADLTIARDGAFTLRDAGEDGVSTWTGVCQVAGS